MVRVGAQDAKSSVVTGPRMAITTSRWTFSLLDASASAEPYRVSLFSLGWELVGVCWATHSEWILNQLNPFYIILPYFPRTLRIRGVCFEIVALFPLFPGQNEMATVSAVYSVLGFKLIEATDPGYPQSIPIRQTFWTLAKQSFEVLLFLPATFLPMFWHGSTRWGPDSENPQCYDLRLQQQSEWTRRPYIRHPVAYRVTRTFACYGLRQSKSFLVWISIDSNSHPNVQWPLHSIQ